MTAYAAGLRVSEVVRLKSPSKDGASVRDAGVELRDPRLDGGRLTQTRPQILITPYLWLAGINFFQGGNAALTANMGTALFLCHAIDQPVSGQGRGSASP